mgnify:FL=1
MSFIVSLLTTLVALFIYLQSGKVSGDRPRLLVRVISGLIFMVAAIAVLFRNVILIGGGNVGVVESFGQISSKPLLSGVHLVNPFSTVEVYSTRLKDLKETIEATSKEGLSFKVDVSLQYQVDPERAVEIYQKVGDGDNEAAIIAARFRSITRTITAKYPIEAIYSTKRQEVSDAIAKDLAAQLQPIGLKLDGVYLREVILPESLQAAIQEKLKADQQNQQMEFTIAQAKKEAERKRIEARGNADAQRILSSSITSGILQLRSIEAMEKLAASKNTKVVVVGGNKEGSVPTILSLDGSTVAPK